MSYNFEKKGIPFTKDGDISNINFKQGNLTQKLTFFQAGDSAYAISDVMITPYSQAEVTRDPAKRAFNSRFCGMRTEMIGKITFKTMYLTVNLVSFLAFLPTCSARDQNSWVYRSSEEQFNRMNVLLEII